MPLEMSKKTLAVFEPMVIAMIATYPKMNQILQELVEGTGIRVVNIYASFNDAVEEAKKIEDKVDVILTRGGTGHYIKKNVSVPVISIPITPFDLLLSVSLLPLHFKKIAFVNYQRAIFGVERIAQLFGKEILQYSFLDKEDLRQVAEKAKADGCDVFLGGAEGVANARALGMEALEITSGKEAVFQALVEAAGILNVKREEKKHSARLKSAFDALAEGICVADEDGKISVFNPAAVRIFGLNGQELIGKNIHDTPVGTSAVVSFDRFEKQVDHLEHIRDITVNANHIPIYLERNFIGTVSTFQDVSKIQRLEGQIRRQLSQKGFVAKYTFQDILTRTPQMEVTKRLAELYAGTDAAVLIEGESGTGKELFAHSIHSASACSVGPFVTVNCAAIPEQLLESELFGYAPGAFTGARKEGKPGLFELAHNGTLFLDEIGEMPMYLQSRLLRVLQEKEVMRVGGSKITSVNCRIISATNKKLADLVQKGEFREDLYYRLSIFTVKVLPLRERKEDIPLLCEKFMRDMAYASLEGMQSKIGQYLEWMRDYDWPGNIRELQSVCARLGLVQTMDQPKKIQEYLNAAVDISRPRMKDTVSLSIRSCCTLKEMQEEAERQYIAAILKRNKNNQSLTAKQLGIGRTTLWRRMEDGGTGRSGAE